MLNMSPTLPTMHLSHRVTSLEAVYMQLPLEQQKALYCFFNITQKYSPKPVNTLCCVKLLQLPFKRTTLNKNIACVS